MVTGNRAVKPTDATFGEGIVGRARGHAMADNAHPQAGEIYATLPAGLVPIDGPGGIAPDARPAGHHAG